MILHCLHSAPNFGKTCGIPKSPALAGSYEGAKGFSEIGRRGVVKKLENGAAMKSVTSTVNWFLIHLWEDQPPAFFPVLPAIRPRLEGMEREDAISWMRPRWCPQVPKTSLNMSGSPQCYTWAGLPRYRMAGWLMLGGMTVSDVP